MVCAAALAAVGAGCAADTGSDLEASDGELLAQEVVDVDRDESPSSSGRSGAPTVVSVTRDEDPRDGAPRSVSVTREPVVPGRPAVPGVAPGRSASTPSSLSGPYFAEVEAMGTGCPAGTWNTAISDDGQTFTTTFNQYSAFVSPKDAISVKDCELSIKLRSPENLSYSVQAFRFNGYAYLEDGVNARHQASFYIQGNPANSIDTETEMDGPVNRPYSLSETVELGDQLWSPCGKERDLNVLTRLRVRNGTPRATGYINQAAITGSAKIVMRMSWRRCEPGKIASTDEVTVNPPSGPVVISTGRDVPPIGPTVVDGPTVVGNTGLRPVEPGTAPSTGGPTVVGSTGLRPVEPAPTAQPAAAPAAAPAPTAGPAVVSTGDREATTAPAGGPTVVSTGLRPL